MRTPNQHLWLRFEGCDDESDFATLKRGIQEAGGTLFEMQYLLPYEDVDSDGQYFSHEGIAVFGFMIAASESRYAFLERIGSECLSHCTVCEWWSNVSDEAAETAHDA